MLRGRWGEMDRVEGLMDRKEEAWKERGGGGDGELKKNGRGGWKE